MLGSKFPAAQTPSLGRHGVDRQRGPRPPFGGDGPTSAVSGARPGSRTAGAHRGPVSLSSSAAGWLRSGRSQCPAAGGPAYRRLGRSARGRRQRDQAPRRTGPGPAEPGGVALLGPATPQHARGVVRGDAWDRQGTLSPNHRGVLEPRWRTSQPPTWSDRAAGLDRLGGDPRSRAGVAGEGVPERPKERRSATSTRQCSPGDSAQSMEVARGEGRPGRPV